MAKTMRELKKLLGYIEYPDSNIQSAIKISDIPNLIKIAEDTNSLLATRAIGALCMLKDERVSMYIQKVMASDIPIFKIALAANLQFLSKEDFEKVVPVLLEDSDLGVRKITLKSLPQKLSKPIKNQVKKIALYENNLMVQLIAAKILDRVS